MSQKKIIEILNQIYQILFILIIYQIKVMLKNKKFILKDIQQLQFQIQNKNTKETIEDNDKNDKWKRRRKDMIPRKLKNKRIKRNKKKYKKE